MVCTDLPATGQNSLTHCKARIWLSWLSKKIQTHSPKWLTSSSVSKRSAYPMQNYVCISPGQRVLATNLLPLTAPGWRPTVQNSSQHKNGWGLQCRKVNILEDLGLGTRGCHKHSHSLQLANHTQLAICFINSFRFFFLIQEDFFKVPHSHH